MSKYRSRKTTVDGIVFDSAKEARRYTELKLQEEAGKIQNLVLQPKFLLIPAQKEPDSVGPKGGVRKGKTIEKACYYKADFEYVRDGKLVVEDVKGMRTPEYIIKRKLMLWVHGIKVTEI